MSIIIIENSFKTCKRNELQSFTETRFEINHPFHPGRSIGIKTLCNKRKMYRYYSTNLAQGPQNVHQTKSTLHTGLALLYIERSIMLTCISSLLATASQTDLCQIQGAHGKVNMCASSHWFSLIMCAFADVQFGLWRSLYIEHWAMLECAIWPRSECAPEA